MDDVARYADHVVMEGGTWLRRGRWWSSARRIGCASSLGHALQRFWRVQERLGDQASYRQAPLTL